MSSAAAVLPLVQRLLDPARVDERISPLLARYVELLLTWNRRINLSAARTAEAVLQEHIADSLEVVPYIPAEATSLLDVGSGGGFPGIVIAIVRPELAVTLLEPVHKKQAFLATAARELPLPNVQAHPRRLEEHEGQYDVAVSRATWPVPEWLERAKSVVRPGGLALAMEGREQHALPAGAVRHSYQRGDRTRAVIALPY